MLESIRGEFALSTSYMHMIAIYNACGIAIYNAGRAQYKLLKYPAGYFQSLKVLWKYPENYFRVLLKHPAGNFRSNLHPKLQPGRYFAEKNREEAKRMLESIRY